RAAAKHAAAIKESIMKGTAMAISLLLLGGGPAFANPAIDVVSLTGDNSAVREEPAAGLVKHQGAVAYVSGGVGDDEERQLRAMASQFNLGVTLSTPDGHFLGGARLRIFDSGGKQVLDADASGPLFYAQLPAGAYRIEAAAAGNEATRKVDVAPG